MPNRFTSTFALFAIATAIWTGSVELSSYLAKGLERERDKAIAESSGEHAAPQSLHFVELRKKIEASPDNPELYMQLASALVGKAYQDSEVALVMEAVQVLHQLLDRKSEYPEALLALARICVENGILDKAREYYPRYLKQRPDDDRASIDYALVLVQTNEAQNALAVLKPILERLPQSFHARLTYALAHRVDGNIDEARKHATKAQEFAPSEEAKTQAGNFLASLDSPDKSVATASSPTPPSDGSKSTAVLVNDFFRNHTIVGPKVRRITWPELARTRIDLQDFPVDAMPPFAKQKFIGNIKTHFAELQEGLVIELFDVVQEKVVLSLNVGKGSS